MPGQALALANVYRIYSCFLLSSLLNTTTIDIPHCIQKNHTTDTPKWYPSQPSSCPLFLLVGKSFPVPRSEQSCTNSQQYSGYKLLLYYYYRSLGSICLEDLLRFGPVYFQP